MSIRFDKWNALKEHTFIKYFINSPRLRIVYKLQSEILNYAMFGTQHIKIMKKKNYVGKNKHRIISFF